MAVIRAGELEVRTVPGTGYAAAYKEVKELIESYEAAGVVLNTH